jgi:hypothetical protein
MTVNLQTRLLPSILWKEEEIGFYSVWVGNLLSYSIKSPTSKLCYLGDDS